MRKNKEEREQLKQYKWESIQMEKSFVTRGDIIVLSLLVVCTQYRVEAVTMAGAIFLWKEETDRETHSL